MKSVTINNEVLGVLLSNLSAFKNAQNCIRFVIGVVNTGDGLGSQMAIVNGGQMGRFAFKTGLPVEEVTVSPSSPYMSFNLRASEFCNYLSALLSFATDITLGYDGATVYLNAGEQAKIALGTVADDACEPFLVDDTREASVMVTMKGDDFIKVMRKGAYLSESKPCSRKITDRVVFSINDGLLTVYSSDTHVIAKSWCNVAVQKMDANAALYFLQTKGATANEEEKARIFARFKEIQGNPEAVIAFAEEEGFVSENVVKKNALGYIMDLAKTMDKEEQKQLLAELTPLQNDATGLIRLAKSKGFEYDGDMRVSIPHDSAVTLQKLFTDSETVQMLFTQNNLHISNGSHINVTMSLAGEVASVYKGTVDQVWGAYDWSAKVVVDREAFARALSLMKLNGVREVMHVSVDGQGLVVSKDSNIIHTPIIASEGDTKGVDAYFRDSKISLAMSKLSNGNLVIRFLTGASNSSFPICLSNGGISEENIDSYEYVMPSVYQEDEEPAETAGNAEEATAD